MLATRVSKGIITKPTRPLSLSRSSEVCNSFVPIDRKGLSNAEIVESCHLSLRNRAFLSPLVTRRRKPDVCVCDSQLSSDYDVSSSDVEEETLSSAGEDTLKLAGTPAGQSKSRDVKHEVLMLSFPAIGGQALEPLAQLMETAYIGRLGPVELGSAGISTNIFNCISKLFNIPLLSVATSFVAEDISKNSVKDSASEDSTNGKPAERKQLSSVSTALLLAVGIGIIEALALYLGSGKFLDLMGISSGSSMRIPAQRFLSLRAFGAPAVVVSLALQGVFRGFKDTKTPVLCLGIGNLSAVFLFPILMYYFQLGATGAAISTVLSQYIVTFLLIWHLNKRAVLLPPKLGSLQFGGYLKSGGFLLGRTLAVLITMTLGTSMAARQGPVAMAAHQICIQVWLAVSLLTDALAASGQALIASSFSKGDYQSVKDITDYVLKIGLFTGVFLSAVLGVSFGSLATVFTKDAEVLEIVRTGVLFVSASQPLNALAFIFDGLHYGVSDFPYAAYSMMISGAICSTFLLYAPSILGLPGVWLGLTLFMGLRTVAGFARLLSKNGPWWFLHRDCQRTEVSMESNGKGVSIDGVLLPFEAGEIDFGEPGTNGQHSFYQLIHQGRVIPCDFIGVVKSQQPVYLKGEVVSNHDELMSNFFAQPDALAYGKTPEQLHKENVPPHLIPHKTFSGNRPSLSLLLPSLNAYNIGQLLAIYEHRIAVEGFVWGINSFDQWGVELGKSLATQVRKQLHASRTKGEPVEGFNFSTATLLTRYLEATADIPADPPTLLPRI